MESRVSNTAIPFIGIPQTGLSKENPNLLAMQADRLFLGVGGTIAEVEASLRKAPTTLPHPEELRISGEDIELATKYPNLMAARYALASVLPGANLIEPTARKELLDMGIPVALLLTTIDAAAFIPGIGKAASAAAKRLGHELLHTGLEVTSKVTPRTILRSKLALAISELNVPSRATILRKTFKGISEHEAGLLAMGDQAMTGYLKTLHPDIPVEEIARRFSPAMRKLIQVDPIRQTIKISPEVLTAASRRQRFRQAYLEAVRQEKSLQPYLSPVNTERLFKAQLKSLYGKAAPAIGLGEATPTIFKLATAQVKTQPDIVRKAAALGSLAYVRPIRKVLGEGETLYSTYSRVYKPLTKAIEQMYEIRYDALRRWHGFLGEYNLGRILLSRSGPQGFKPIFTHKEQMLASEFLHFADEATRKKFPGYLKHIKRAWEKLPSNSQRLVKAYRAWADYEYLEHVCIKLEQAMAEYPLSGDAAYRLEKLMESKDSLRSRLGEIFNPQNNISKANKSVLVAKEIALFKKRVLETPEIRNALLQLPAPLRKQFVMDLTLRKDGGTILNYLDNYAQRIGQQQEQSFTSLVNDVFRIKAAGYTLRRTAEETAAIPSLAELVEIRASTQAKELALQPLLHHHSEFAQYVKELPEDYRKYITHYISRMLGRPSPADIKIAAWINRIFKKQLSGADIDAVAREINNFCYMGILGLRPFSALRNLFDPLKAVPDLGGVREIGTFVKGLSWVRNPANREYLERIGIITEYAPELFAEMKAWTNERIARVLGKEISLPDIDRLRDATLYLFSQSDKWGRLVTGGAAAVKWDTALEAVGRKTSVGYVIDDIPRFMKAAGINGRERWIQKEIGTLLKNREYEKARELFIKDVVDDVNFLYGKKDAPLGIYVAGAPGKLSAIYQSWTINFIELLRKWAVTGHPPERFLTYTVTSAMAFMVMEALWGKRIAGESTFLGPVEPNFPIIFDPVIGAVKTAIRVGTLQLPEARQEAKRLLSRIEAAYLPAGAQLTSMLKAYKQSGAEGLLASAAGGFQRGELFNTIIEGE